MLGSTLGDYAVFDLPRLDNSIIGHELTVTVMPRADDMDTQTFIRAFRTGKHHCTHALCHCCRLVIAT